MQEETLTPGPSQIRPTLATALPAELRDWVAGAAANGWTRDQARAWLSAAGWSGPAVEAALDDFARHQPPLPFHARPPRPERSHAHGLAYSVLLWGVGLGALALGSSLHLVLQAALHDQQASRALASWLTLFVCTVPFVLVTGHQVARIEREDPLARLSGTRDTLSLVLLWAAGIVGVLRLLVFVHQAISGLVVERTATGLLANLAHVSVVVLVAGGVFSWTWDLRRGSRGRPEDAST